MVHVAGAWELGWNTPIKEADLWEMPLRDFGVDRWFMSPVSGISYPGLSEVADLRELIEDHRADGVPVVFVDEAGAVDLRDFVHPTNALYVFGKTSLSPMVAYGLESDLSVRIKTVNDSGLLWSHQAAVMVLYDRMVKV